MKSRNANPFLPPARVLVMIAMLAIMLSFLFALMTASAIIGSALGLAFAAAFYFIVVVNARRAGGKRRRRR